jgi:hypothetical protein
MDNKKISTSSRTRQTTFKMVIPFVQVGQLDRTRRNAALICMCQELSTELFDEEAFQKQQDALENGLIKIPSDQPLHHSVD